MKLTFCIVVAFIATINRIICDQITASSISSSSSLVNFQCPEKFGYFPDPYDCSKYFVCVFGDPLHESCTGGLFFSADHQTCDWPRNSPCQQSSSAPTIDVTAISDHRAAATISDNTKDQILNLPASFSNRDLINDSSFGHVTSSSSPSSSSSSSSSRENSQLSQAQNFHHSLNNNLRHSILTQSSSGPKYESSSSTSSKSSSITAQVTSPLSSSSSQSSSSSSSSSADTLYDQDFRDDNHNDNDDQSIHNSKSQRNLQSNSPITDHSKSVTITSAQNTGSNFESHHHLHHINNHHAVDDDKIRNNKNNSTKYSLSSFSSLITSRNSLATPLPSLLIPTTTKTPVIFVSDGTDDTLHYSNLNERKIHIHNLTPRRRPPKRIEVPFSSTPITSNNNNNKIKSSTPVPVAINNNRHNAINRQSLSSSSSSSPSLSPAPTSNEQFAFSIFSNSNQSHFTVKDRTISLLPVLRSANNHNHNNVRQQSTINLISPQSSVVTSTLSPFSTSTTDTSSIINNSPSSTSSSINEAHSLSNLFPEDGQPFGLLDYELSDTDDNDRQGSFRQLDDTIVDVKPSTSFTGDNSPSPPYSTSFDSKISGTSSINSDKSVDTRLQDEVPSDVSRIATPSSSQSNSYHPSSSEVKCNSSNCRLPNCNCGSSKIPNNLKIREIPQIILLTFDDAVNDLNWDIYEQIFNSRRVNPNGCPILGTFYVSHEWTDYSQVQTLYSRGHEIASHGITHSFGEKFTKNQWLKEIDGQRQILNRYAGVKLSDVRGMRAPFLQIGGNRQFEMLHEANFTYDSSMPIFENDPPFYPYTLDYPLTHECMITPCPSKSFPGLWEVGLVMYQDLNGGRCSMADACQNPPDDETVFKMLVKNFNRHYKSNRAPFGLFYHSAWFNTQHHLKGFLKFIDHVLTKSDVYFTTNWQMIEWMKQPTTLNNIASVTSWNCRNRQRPISECLTPHVCNVKHKEGSRFMKTCQTCPLNYPWLGRIA